MGYRAVSRRTCCGWRAALPNTHGSHALTQCATSLQYGCSAQASQAIQEAAISHAAVRVHAEAECARLCTLSYVGWL